MFGEYPYLVAGLPVLALDSEGKKLDMDSLREELREGMSSSDYRDMLWFVYPADNWNLLSLDMIPGDGTMGVIPGGEFSLDQLRNGLESGADFPSYMKRYFQELNRKPSKDDQEEEPQEFNLLAEFYKEAAKSRCSLVRNWYDFEHSLQNAKAAVAARRLGRNREGILIPGGQYYESFLKSNASDFGLRGAEPWIDDFLSIIEIEDAMERERRFEMLRWKKMDELTHGHYIDVFLIHAFMMKAMTVAHWLNLDPSTGSEMFRQLIKEARGDFDLRNAIENK